MCFPFAVHRCFDLLGTRGTEEGGHWDQVAVLATEMFHSPFLKDAVECIVSFLNQR